MKTNVAPLLPMALPEFDMSAPDVPTVKASSTEDLGEVNTGTVLHVDADTLEIDSRFGMNRDELVQCHAAAIAATKADLYHGRPQSAVPLVSPMAEGRYAVLTEIPVALAAMALRAEEGEQVPLTVMVSDTLHGEALLTGMFERARSRTLYEQARYIQGCEAIYKSRRAWMRAENIDHRKWEPRLSKIANINALDLDLMTRIDPFTISNAEVASKIVDIWADPQRREVALAVTEAEARKTNGRMKAPALFKKIIAAVDGGSPRFSITPSRDGACEMRAPDGQLIAVARIADSGWSITGGDASTMTSAAIGALYRALQAHDAVNGRS